MRCSAGHHRRPENGFTPDYGRITAYRSAAGFGLRLDGGTAYSGAVITPYYDSLLVKVTAWAPTAAEAIRRMDRALREFRIRGVSTNLQFLENVINHPDFVAGDGAPRASSTHARAVPFRSGATAPPAAALPRRRGGQRQSGHEGRAKPACRTCPIPRDRPDAARRARATAEGARRRRSSRSG
jgi:pyruvate carboxylase